MRSASSYRGARRAAAQETGESWNDFQKRYWGNRASALANIETRALKMTPEQAREALARWANNPSRDVVSVTELLPKPKEQADDHSDNGKD